MTRRALPAGVVTVRCWRYTVTALVCLPLWCQLASGRAFLQLYDYGNMQAQRMEERP